MFYITHIGICHAAFVSGTCLMLITMTRIIKEDLSGVNKSVKNNGNRFELMNLLTKCIDFHSIVKQLSILKCRWESSLSINPVEPWFKLHVFPFIRFVTEFSSVYEIVILIVFFWSLLTICGGLLLIQMEIVECFDKISSWISF